MDRGIQYEEKKVLPVYNSLYLAKPLEIFDELAHLEVNSLLSEVKLDNSKKA